VSLDIRSALRRGYDDVTTEAGLNVFSVFLVFNVGYTAVSESFRQGLRSWLASGRPGTRPGAITTPPFGVEFLRFDLPLALLAVLTVAVVLANEAVRCWAIQAFVDRPVPALLERGRVIVVVGGGVALLVFGIRQVLPAAWVGQGGAEILLVASAAGFAAAPMLLVTVYFTQEIALTEADSAEVVRNGLSRFRDTFVRIFGLLLILVLIGELLLLPTAVLSRVTALRVGTTLWLLSEVLNHVLFAALSTFSTAVITEAYLQSRTVDPDRGV
jgi:hypothetical protein